MDYVDYKVRTHLTQSLAGQQPCDDWDALNQSLLDLYDNKRLNVRWNEKNEPAFSLKKTT